MLNDDARAGPIPRGDLAEATGEGIRVSPTRRGGMELDVFNDAAAGSTSQFLDGFADPLGELEGGSSAILICTSQAECGILADVDHRARNSGDCVGIPVVRDLVADPREAFGEVAGEGDL